MRRRPVFAIATLVTVAAGAFALPVHAGRRHGGCHPRRSEVVARKGKAVVFYRAGPESEYPGPSVVLGCLTSRQRPKVLLRFAQGQSPQFEPLGGRKVVFAGRYAAFAISDYDVPCQKYTGGGPECESHWLGSYDLRAGRARATAASAALTLVLSESGWIAWVTPTDEALHARDSHGERLLDPGPVDPASLRLAGQTVQWTAMGTAHEAALS